MIEKIDARLARLAARHDELSTFIQNASVELAQNEGAQAHLTDLKREVEEAAAVAEKEPRSIFHAPEAEGRVATEDDIFPVEWRLKRELARTAQVGAGPMESPEAERSE